MIPPAKPEPSRRGGFKAVRKDLAVPHELLQLWEVERDGNS